jgi:hypothetical protein
MNKQLALVRQCREARRQAALARLAEAERAAAAAQAAVEHRSRQRDDALGDVLHLRSGRSAGLTQDQRWSLMPSAHAVHDLAERAVLQAQADVEAAHRGAADCRQALITCERALLRNDELLATLKSQALERSRLAEQSVDDEIAITWRPAGR